MRVVRAAVVMAMAVALLTGCFPVIVSPGGGGSGKTSEPPVSQADKDAAIIDLLRTTSGPDEELAVASDEDLLTLTKGICDRAEAGATNDDIVRAWMDAGLVFGNTTIFALFAAAKTYVCPDVIDTDEWVAESPLWTERAFLDYIAEHAGIWGHMPDEDSIGAARSVCQAFAEGESVDTISDAMHSALPTGSAPDREGALAFIAAAVWAYCPDIDLGL